MTLKQKKALTALLTSITREEAATVAGVSTETIRRYMKDPEFKEAYRAAFADVLEDAARQAQHNISPALVALAAIVDSPEEAATARISAARSVLEYALKLSERVDVTDRINALEAKLTELENGNG